MVITGEPRGNGKQLGDYLLDQADNDRVEVFDIRGTAHQNDLKKSLLEMSLTSELTKSDMGLFHAQISPAPGEDKTMTPEQWLRAAEILEESLDAVKGVGDKGFSFSKQKRVMVLHDKQPDHIHMHVVWERYDHEQGIMIPDKFSRQAQNQARRKMELEFGHKLTPLRNAKRPELKALITELWAKTATGAEFIKEALRNGYVVAKGELRRPFMVIDEKKGRSFDLVKQIDGVKTKEVRQRLKGEDLPAYKQVIKEIRAKEKANKVSPAQQSITKQLTTVEAFEKKAAQALKEQREAEKQRYIRELQEQLEKRRQNTKSRGLEL